MAESAATQDDSRVLPESLGPVVVNETKDLVEQATSLREPNDLFPVLPSQNILETTAPWTPSIVPFLEAPVLHESDLFTPPELDNQPNKRITPAKILAVDVHPKLPQIAILIDDLGYNRQGMKSSLLLPAEVALAILPGTPFALQTALASQKQQRITLLHAPMENLRELKLGPGGLYARMSETELKDTLTREIESLPGIQGVNNHMGSLLTAKADSMRWVMETLQGRSLFFIDSLTSAKSVAKKTAQEYGLPTVSRDVFLDNIRTEQAIDRQFSRLLTLARRHGSALAIGHPYPETTAYLKKRLAALERDGVRLVPLSEVLLPSDEK
ncbi:divergent polysaccharide deacetylase family protein [Marinomonas sp. M1K-6]|uniref:Divergent polysaccharide deacetylase family protein n=2 Tax=Marinomonas profundi TaxID=2726122 RepID=A0A847R4R6_9GAMM|nr:divergent polysaccharide deacetylase family protein [Marinomonas profundi]UDV04872.1 divergent polysaccharide deacetylase family protein [Marinomonas profundi]